MRRASPPRLAALALALLVAAGAQPARAFDLFGLFGSEPEPPPPSATALPYTLRITGTDDSDVLRALQDTSTLYRLRQEPRPTARGCCAGPRPISPSSPTSCRATATIKER